jgi:hypothetical protein
VILLLLLVLVLLVIIIIVIISIIIVLSPFLLRSSSFREADLLHKRIHMTH